MRSRFYAVIFVCFVLVIAGLAWPYETPAAGDKSLTPVVVELFTSQGCSSCPPADELLRSLERNQPVAGALIIPLSEHVDYWNRLGWRDPFSSKRFTARQQTYAKALDTRNVYTPMMVVDGQTAFVGSRPIAAREAVVSALKSPKAQLTIETTIAPDRRILRVTGVAKEIPAARNQPDAWVAITESQLSTKVTRGENSSRTLSHTGVVRKLDWIGALPEPQPDVYRFEARVRLDPSWKFDHLRVVVFLQEQPSGRIIGATQLPVG